MLRSGNAGNCGVKETILMSAVVAAKVATLATKVYRRQSALVTDQSVSNSASVSPAWICTDAHWAQTACVDVMTPYRQPSALSLVRGVDVRLRVCMGVFVRASMPAELPSLHAARVRSCKAVDFLNRTEGFTNAHLEDAATTWATAASTAAQRRCELYPPSRKHPARDLRYLHLPNESACRRWLPCRLRSPRQPPVAWYVVTK
jgi:hypothetical protein